MSVFPVMVIGEESLPVLILTKQPFLVFFLFCPADEGSDRMDLVGTKETKISSGIWPLVVGIGSWESWVTPELTPPSPASLKL